jgi:hypothetical protein
MVIAVAEGQPEWQEERGNGFRRQQLYMLLTMRETRFQTQKFRVVSKFTTSIRGSNIDVFRYKSVRTSILL